jgi:hypothetical protein
MTPANVTSLNLPGDDADPHIAPDGLTIYFTSNREHDATAGDHDLWVAARASRSLPFDVPQRLGGGVNGPRQDVQATVTEEGRVIVFVRSDGSWSSNDLYMAERDSDQEAFGTAVRLGGDVSLDGFAEAYPWISPDGLRLYFTSNRTMGGDETWVEGDDDIWVADRGHREETFRNPRRLLEDTINTAEHEMAFTMQYDEHVAFFTRWPGMDGNGEIYLARRDSREDRFGEPELLAVLSHRSFDCGPSVTRDGMELFFFSDARRPGHGGHDIWAARREGTYFIRGDFNADGSVGIADVIAILMYLYDDAVPPPFFRCEKSGDAGDDGSLNVGDAILVLKYLFSRRPSPVRPFPACGWDPTLDNLTCESFPVCGR